MIKKIVQLIIFLGLGIFFIWLSFKDITPEQLDEIRTYALEIINFKSLFFIFLSMICGIIAHYCRALRNILMIDPLGYKVRKTTAFYSVMTCYLGNLALPRLGEVLRCTFMQRYDKVPFQKSIGTVVVERAFDLLIFVVLFILVFIFSRELLSEMGTIKQLNLWMSEKTTMLWKLKYYIIATLIGLTVLVLIYKRNKKQSKFLTKIKKIIVGLWQGLISVKDLKNPYLFLFYTVIIWTFYYLGIYLCFFAFDFLHHLGPMPAFIVMVVGTIGFIIAQGGLGAYPLFVAGILALYGIDYTQGLTAGWIGWGAQTLMILIVGLTALILASFLKVEDRRVNNG
jgi:uncharacterized protein (TIRG00374 family)